MITSKATAPVFGAPPKVNLLPPAERDRRERQALVRRWGAIAVGVGVLVAVTTLALAVREHAARSDLAAEQARTSDLARRLTAYGDVSAAVQERGAYEAFRAQVMGTDVSWRAVLGALQGEVPAGAAITGFDVVVASEAPASPGSAGSPTASPAASAAASAAASPAASAAAGATAASPGAPTGAPPGTAVTATLTVTSRHPLDNKAMLASFAKLPGVVGAELQDLSSEKLPDYTATTVVYFDSTVYSRRYVRTDR